MSRLQELIDKIVQIIVSYNETQTNTNTPPELYLNKSSEQMQAFLKPLIKEATIVYKTRESLLDYFLFVAKTIKPLADQKNSLTKPEEQHITEVLRLLLNTIKKLLTTSHSNTITIQYDNLTIQIPGFVRGAFSGYSLCNSGQVINRELSDILNMPTNDYTAKLISDHQLPFLEIERLGKVIINEKELTQTEVNKLQKIIEEQQKQLATFQNENSSLSDKLANAESNIQLQEKQLRQEIETLQHKNSRLSNELENRDAIILSQKQQPRPELEENIQLQQELTSVRVSNKDYLEEINRLIREISNLQDTPETSHKKYYNIQSYSSLFAQNPVSSNFDTIAGMVNHTETNNTSSTSNNITLME